MKKTLLVILAVVVVIVAVCVVNYNRIVTQQSAVEEGQANIQAQLQRRADLIPNLAQTVQNFTAHETEAFAAVNAAHEAFAAARTIPELAEADGQMTSALNGLVALAEAYPELKSDTVYVGLMDELAGTENRIAVARTDYNVAVQAYNLAIRKFPGSLFAKQFGFVAAPFFEASEAASTVPTIS